MSKKAGPGAEDLLASLDDLGKEAATRPAPKSTKPRTTGVPTKSSQNEKDLQALKDLSDLAKPTSRPGTPSLKPGAGGASSTSRSPARGSTATPPPPRTSEDAKSQSQQQQQRKSGDSARSTQPAYTPATTTSAEEEAEQQQAEAAPVAAKSGGGGWWGGILSTATAAVSQAQKAVQDIQKNEEAQKYLEQVKGNVGVIRGFGKILDCLFSSMGWV
jgi:hypothetical protein